MAAPESTKFQANFKLADGTLLNLYATTQAELEAELTTLQDVAELIKATSVALNGAGNASYAAAAFSATPMQDVPPFNAAPAATGADPQCKHGVMQFRSGVNAQGKAWKGWMCAAPRGASDKCEAVWVRQIVREPYEYEAPLCAESGGDHWFPEKEVDYQSQVNIKYAKTICGSCIHQTECAEWGIKNEYHGIWGGLTVRTRAIIRRQRNIIIRGENVA